MRQTSYDFNIETETEHNDAQANLPDTGPLSPTDLAIVDAEHTYDVGIEVTGGDLKGAKIGYDSSEPVQPTFGPTAEVPLLDVPDVDAVGVPVNLQPPTVFTTAVKIFIPCAGQTDASNLCVYLYNGTDYVLACDADGNVQPGGEGWMVPDSRVDHPETNPPSIEIKVYHFSGVQAGVPGSSDSGAPGGGGGGCFIATAAFGSYAGPHINVLRDFRDEYLLTNGPGRWFVRTYYRYGSYVADYMNTHTWCKPLVRFALMPVVGLSYVMVKTSLEPSFLAAALLLAAFILTCFIRNQLSTRFERN
ncbi:MAG: hypothetical protein HWN51_00220 [Desulfobacterales bacterium]|nr:hypothetical protein [Desulfobacterales bacterium]